MADILTFGRPVPEGMRYVFVKGLGMRLRKISRTKELNRLRQALQRSKNGKFQTKAQEVLADIARTLKLDSSE